MTVRYVVVPRDRLQLVIYDQPGYYSGCLAEKRRLDLGIRFRRSFEIRSWCSAEIAFSKNEVSSLGVLLSLPSIESGLVSTSVP
jgi:hypothetical protein